MTDEPFWDELGIAWQAASPALDVPLERMKAHFRRESLQVRIEIGVAILVSIGGLALGAFTMWQAWRLSALNFGLRGLALLIIAVIIGVIARTLWPVRGSDEARSLSDFVELGLARSTRHLLVCALGLVVCAVGAVGGVLGTISRNVAGHPPGMSPAIALIIIALGVVVLEFERRRLRRKQARFVYLRRALRQQEG